MTLHIDVDKSVEATLARCIKAVREEECQSSHVLHLTAYENRMSKLAQSFLSSNLSFRHHEGTFSEHHFEEVVLNGTFMFKGLPGLYQLENAALKAAGQLFHAALSDFRPTSGMHAMLTTFENAGAIIPH